MILITVIIVLEGTNQVGEKCVVKQLHKSNLEQRIYFNTLYKL